MSLWDFVQLTAQIAYARLLATVGPWWPFGVVLGAVVLIVIGYRKSTVRIPWAQIGRIAVMVLLGAVVACWLIFGVIALAPVALLVAVISGLIAAFAWLFKWLDGRAMVPALSPDEKRALAHLHYNPIDEFGGGCRVASRYVPVTGFDYQGQADMWLEQCQRAYRPSEEE